MSSSTFNYSNGFSLQGDAGIEVGFESASTVFSVSTLAVLIPTKASDEGKLGAAAERKHHRVLHAASHADDPLLLAVQRIQSLGHPHDLLGVLACMTCWLYIDASLEVGTCAPRVNHVALVNGEAVASARSNLDNASILQGADERGRPPWLSVSLAQLPEYIKPP